MNQDGGDGKTVNLSYHFQYGDKILLRNISEGKFLQCSDYPSEVSKNLEVSLCERGEKGMTNHPYDEWEVTSASTTHDSYWRVG
jgi:hypothetical protein